MRTLQNYGCFCKWDAVRTQQPRQLSSIAVPRSGLTLPRHRGQREDGAREGRLISSGTVSEIV